jgi:hypothetical protein
MTFRLLAQIFGGSTLLLLLVLAALWHVALERIKQLRTGFDLAVKSAEDANGAAGELADLARTHERRASEFFGIIEGIEKERDTWQRFYRESSQAAGVAQAWLMRDLQRVVRVSNGLAAELQKLGKQAPIVQADPALASFIEEFDGSHVSTPQEVPKAPGKPAA